MKKFKKLAENAVLAVGLLSGLGAGAATWNVTNVTELTNAVAKAAFGDTIVLAAGRYDLSKLASVTNGTSWGTMGAPDANGYACLWWGKALTLVGADARSWRDKTEAESTILDGGEKASVIYVYGGGGRGSNFYNLTFENGKATKVPLSAGKTTKGEGGGLYALGPASGFVTNCVFRSCSAAAYGGGENAYSVSDSLFEDCQAGQRGGGAYADGSNAYSTRTNQILRCEFRNCQASQLGGGVYCHETRDIVGPKAGFVADCVFSNCTAATGGGAVYQNYAGLIRGCRFVDNTSPMGAVSCTSRFNSLITNCTFVGNSSTKSGGAVTNWNEIVASSFSGNTATERGGAVAGVPLVRACTFAENSALAEGGAIASVTRADSCTFIRNGTKKSGGAQYGGTATNCVFVSNCSTNQGGACGLVTAIGCTFSNNCAVAQRAGATYQGSATRCRYENNTCAPSARGGACAFTNCRFCYFTGIGDVSCGYFDRCEFDGVVADGQKTWVFDCVRNGGGQIYVTNCLVHDCTVTYLAYSEGNKAEFVNCTFADNILADRSSNLPYAIYCDRGTDYKKKAGSDQYRYFPSTNLIENCLFVGNRHQSSPTDAYDLRVWMRTDETDFGFCELTIRNCVYERGLVLPAASAHFTSEALKQGAARFVAGDARYPDAPYYSLRHGSAARNAGVNSDWMASAVDFAGQSRILEGTVDAGCYECVLPAVGAMLLVK